MTKIGMVSLPTGMYSVYDYKGFSQNVSDTLSQLADAILASGMVHMHSIACGDISTIGFLPKEELIMKFTLMNLTMGGKNDQITLAAVSA
jgi:hypothetical protein